MSFRAWVESKMAAVCGGELTEADHLGRPQECGREVNLGIKLTGARPTERILHSFVNVISEVKQQAPARSQPREV